MSGQGRWSLGRRLGGVLGVLVLGLGKTPPGAGGADCLAVSGEVVYWGSTSLNEWKGTNRSLYGELRSMPSGTFEGWACVDMGQWDSENTIRDKHARLMFEVDRYPEACYWLREARRQGDSVVLQGDMEIHGVRRPLSIEGQIQGRDSDFRLQAHFQTRISDWGMKPPRLMAVMKVQDSVRVEIDAELRPSSCGRVVRHRPSGQGSPSAPGAPVYEAYCSFCHMPQGQGQGPYPPVTHVPALLRHPEGRAYLTRVVLYGLFGPIEVGGKRYEGFLMPAFGDLMDDETVARILNEVVFALGRASTTDVRPFTPEEVRRYRTPETTPADMGRLRQKIVQALQALSP